MQKKHNQIISRIKFKLVLTTVAGTGSDGVLLTCNELKYAGKVRWERVLAEPFPWTVVQGVVLVLGIINSQL